VYTHGGGRVMYSAASMLGRAVVAAHETGLRVISVRLHARTPRQVQPDVRPGRRVIQEFLKQGQRFQDTAIYGDSSGGGD